MHGQERRRLATGTLTEFDHSYAGTIAELGYPTRSAPRTWRDDSGGAAPAPARGAPVRREHRPRVRGPRPPRPRPTARRRHPGLAMAPWGRAGEGADADAMMPVLAAHVGHADIRRAGCCLRPAAGTRPGMVARAGRECGWVVPP